MRHVLAQGHRTRRASYLRLLRGAARAGGGPLQLHSQDDEGQTPQGEKAK